ncbi:MAG TPA: hypothetical protein VFW59_07935 [Gallionella sp.]|nr:hypothetical protein [Gallionella sp.]
MKNYKIPGFSSAWKVIGRLLAVSLLLYSWSAEATAPRITPKLFGEETQTDILRYRLEQSASAPQSEGELLAELATEAFKAAGAAPVLDVQPSKQLAKYALFNNEAMALIGSPQDFSAKEKKSYRLVTFYLRGGTSDGAPVAMIFGKRARADELYKSFNKGMQAILKSGKYQEILEKHHVKIPSDYAGRLTRLNPAWR